MINGNLSSEGLDDTSLSAQETLALGQAALRQAFVSASACSKEGDALLASAFALRRQSIEMEIKN